MDDYGCHMNHVICTSAHQPAFVGKMLKQEWNRVKQAWNSSRIVQQHTSLTQSNGQHLVSIGMSNSENTTSS